VLVRFEAGRERLSIVDAGVEMVEQVVASEARRAVVVVRGTDADAPQRIQRVDLQRNRSETLIDTRPGQYANVVFGRVEPWSFSNSEGDEIEGRYYLPPDFDADQSYPLIVYYYGGTTPVGRAFTGRYPFNLWAAKGYVVYVLQPRGTIGYGQDFSALHVNAWGKYTADDIIEGTQKFVEAHPFIDGDRIGNIGASYGGFMTMHLATLTDLYAASISHAGISALTSYWGFGWWGYGYSGIASRDSFPWNNPELYVGQSPVYSADQITTPLLLVTGDSDTNVPPGESHHMYTALKLLGREVELVEFPGEDHWILDREQRYVWWDTMLAWFDKWLKDQPEWWYHLYPETAPES
jgi:dipeptidyl aminopeptidase/acylaminoacyl peptidase